MIIEWQQLASVLDAGVDEYKHHAARFRQRAAEQGGDVSHPGWALANSADMHAAALTAMADRCRGIADEAAS